MKTVPEYLLLVSIKNYINIERKNLYFYSKGIDGES